MFYKVLIVLLFMGRWNFWIYTIIFIIFILLIWGVIGGVEAQNVGTSCDIGLGKNLCWKWHADTVGQAQQFVVDAGEAFAKNFK